MTATAVGDAEEGHDQTVWLVLEDDRRPGAPDERARNDPLADELMGKRVGDRFRLTPGSVQDRSATVRTLVIRTWTDRQTVLYI